NWAKYRPSVILVECTYPESPKRRPTRIRDYLAKRNYHWRYFDGLNDFYVAKEFNAPDGAFDRPPNVFDGFKPRIVVDLEMQLKSLTATTSRAREYAKDMELRLAETQQVIEEQIAAFTKEADGARGHTKNHEQELAKTQAELKKQTTALTREANDARSHAKNLERELAKTQAELKKQVVALTSEAHSARDYAKDLERELTKTRQAAVEAATSVA